MRVAIVSEKAWAAGGGWRSRAARGRGALDQVGQEVQRALDPRFMLHAVRRVAVLEEALHEDAREPMSNEEDVNHREPWGKGLLPFITPRGHAIVMDAAVRHFTAPKGRFFVPIENLFLGLPKLRERNLSALPMIALSARAAAGPLQRVCIAFSALMRRCFAFSIFARSSAVSTRPCLSCSLVQV